MFWSSFLAKKKICNRLLLFGYDRSLQKMIWKKRTILNHPNLQKKFPIWAVQNPQLRMQTLKLQRMDPWSCATETSNSTLCRTAAPFVWVTTKWARKSYGLPMRNVPTHFMKSAWLTGWPRCWTEPRARVVELISPTWRNFDVNEESFGRPGIPSSLMQSRGGKIQLLCNAYGVRQGLIHPSIHPCTLLYTTALLNKLIVLTHKNDSYNDGWQQDTDVCWKCDQISIFTSYMVTRTTGRSRSCCKVVAITFLITQGDTPHRS